LLLEIFTGRSPTDDMFRDSLGLHKFTEDALPGKALEIVDSTIWLHEEPMDMPKVVSSVGLGATSGTRRWGVRTPTGADFPRLRKKTPLAVLLMAWAV